MGPLTQPFDYAMPPASEQITGKVVKPLAEADFDRLTRAMRVTKHHHAALTVRESGRTLVIDPGSFTDPLVDLGEVVAIVLTHEHPDHWTPDHLDRLLRNFPDAPIYGPEGVAKAAAGYDITVVTPGETVTV